MKISGECKQCGIPLVLTIDEGYDGVGDPMNLKRLATCNRCYDYKTKRDNLHDLIKRLCNVLLVNPRGGREKVYEAMLKVTRKYAELIQEYNRYRVVLWDEAFARLLMDFPSKWWKILADYRIQCREENRSRTTTVAEV